LSFIKEHSNDYGYEKKQRQKDYAHDKEKDVQALETGKTLIHIVRAIWITSYD